MELWVQLSDAQRHDRLAIARGWATHAQREPFLAKSGFIHDSGQTHARRVAKKRARSPPPAERPTTPEMNGTRASLTANQAQTMWCLTANWMSSAVDVTLSWSII